ncbi:class I adenylate-forming enzyme family protein [Roseivivax isoporae]|uniref:Long-chain fatty acid--CoA ligase n=1 Tax=Roseivivax isoporae LMG 25204 TaxID=1449351 RepID=X7FBY6_9RHOB|nr:AMP-binding protein [Roseivivax isoporae]ETX29601.1 long-chain fatty acid--CoA ligase [Roseivivax isoporae LMG 25204]
MHAARLHDLVDRNAAARPDETAIIDTDGSAASWARYADLSREIAVHLGAAGVGAGDRVLIVAENCLAAAAAIFGASRLGAWAIPVNARMSAAEIARVTAHADPAAVLYTGHVSPDAGAHAAAAGAAPLATGCGALHLAPRDHGPAEDDAEVAVLLYTTGTTGDPKGVMLTHGNLLFAGKSSAELRGMVPGDRIYGALPLTHVFGLASMLTAAAHAGAAIELAARFSPAALFAALKDGATVLPAVPQMHALLMAHAADQGQARLDSPVLRYVSSGAAPLDPAWKRKAEAFYGLPLQNGYGMTESTAGSTATRNPIGSPDTSVGPPLPGVEIAIDDALGNEPGTGEVLTRGPHVMKGYYRNPEATAAALSDGWLRTGDLGRIDAEGRLHIVGRAKELIIRGGFNVYPPEVEAALNDHPAVVQSAVIGRTANGNEDILAFVQCGRERTTPEVLRAFVAERLSAYKRPTQILIVDALPAAPSGKVLKHRLLSHFAERLAEEA